MVVAASRDNRGRRDLVHNRFRAPQVISYTDRLLEQIWSCIASLVVLSAILICGYDPWRSHPLFPALLLIGAGLFISGR